jgi:hypothetical protein
MSRRVPPSILESLVLSEAAVGHIRWDEDAFEFGPEQGVCRGCVWDLEFFLRGANPTAQPATHGRPATVHEVARYLARRGTR